MTVSGVITQLRITDLEASIDFYVSKLGFELDFRYQDFYASIRAGGQIFHLKLVDQADPSIAYVRDGDHPHIFFPTENLFAKARKLARHGIKLITPIAETPWGTREFSICNNPGHSLYFSEAA